MTRLNRLFILISGLAVPSLLFAQTRTPDPARQAYFDALHARVLDLQARHTVTVRGSESPGGLQRGLLLKAAFRTLAAEAPVDPVAFTQFAAERVGATGASTEVLRKALREPEQKPPFVDICVRVLDGSLKDGLSIAKYVTDVDAQGDRAIEAHYQGIIDKLSPAVRNTLLQNVVGAAAAESVSTKLDHLGAATEDADLYKTMMMSMCQGSKAHPPSAPPDRTQGQQNSIIGESQR